MKTASEPPHVCFNIIFGIRYFSTSNSFPLFDTMFVHLKKKVVVNNGERPKSRWKLSFAMKKKIVLVLSA